LLSANYPAPTISGHAANHLIKLGTRLPNTNFHGEKLMGYYN